MEGVLDEGESEIISDLSERELLQTKHRQERKELQDQINCMKKGVPKNNKKMRKEILDKIKVLEKELEEKHQRELSQIEEGKDTDLNDKPLFEVDRVEVEETEIKRISRAQKRRNKKEQEAKERDVRILEQAGKFKDTARNSEMNLIKQILSENELKIYNIPADGNCLYLAINHQLQIVGKQSWNINELRKMTAKFMRDHKDDFMPFMYSEFDDNEDISDAEFEKYCKKVEETSVWGGHLELKALSHIISCPIKVIQAHGPPTIQGESFKGPELTISYHRHLYKLGEHYNSTSPANDVLS